MKRFSIPIAIGVASALAGCAASTRSADPPSIRLASPPAEMVQEIPPPVRLPASAMTQAEVERRWSADRAALVTGRKVHRALVEWYAARDRALAGGPMVIAP